jgi:enoyl-CoA hydratase/carnithine racemase
MLVACVGQANAERIALEGTMLLPDQAEALGLIDRIVPSEDLISVAIGEARRLGSNDARAFASIKGLLRQRTAERMRAVEGQSILDFVDVWYSDSTRRKLEEIVIRE